MTRILIVEDVADTARILGKVIKLTFPDAVIEIAATLPAARGKLSDASPPYDFAILDLRLPGDDGTVQNDMTLCQLIRKHRIPTRVIHITAFADDPEIIRHVQDVHFEKFDPSASSVGEGNDEQAGNSHRQLPDPRSAIAKNRTDWMELVVAGIRSYLYSDRIGAKLDDLFTDSVKGIRHAERAMHGCRDATGGGSVTSRLIDLQGDIRSYWEFLSPALRKRIRSILSVDESRPGDVRVSLIGKVPPASEVPPE